MQAQIEFSQYFLPLFKKANPWLIFEISPTHQNIKHEIELLGIPHTAVGSILLNGTQEVDFLYSPHAGDRFFIEPLKAPIDVSKPTLLRPQCYPKHRFIVDVCVGALTPKLRMMGCDVLADPALHDRDIAKISQLEQRVLLTRDRGLLMRKEVEWGHFVMATDPREQWQEIIDLFAIPWLPEAFQRCMSCNGRIVPVSKEEVWEHLEPKTRLHYEDFSRCDQCKKIYWEGSHYHRMKLQTPPDGSPESVP